LKKLGKGFIDGFVSLIANEKDPHNLMLIFSMLKAILVEFDIVGLQEVNSHLANINERNYLMRRFVISPSLSRRDLMTFTA